MSFHLSAPRSSRIWPLAVFAILGAAYVVLATHFYVSYSDLRIWQIVHQGGVRTPPMELFLIANLWCAAALLPITLVLGLLGANLRATLSTLVGYAAVAAAAWYVFESASATSGSAVRDGLYLVPLVAQIIIGIAIQMLVWTLLRLIRPAPLPTAA